MDPEASPVLVAVGVEDGVVDQENVVFGVSAGLATAPLPPNTFELPLDPNAVDPAPKPVVPRVPCVPLPNPMNAGLDAAVSPPKAPNGEADDEFAVLNADGVFWDSFD